MNIQEYIESGILEAYLLDELSIREAQHVAELIEKYPTLKKELEDIESTFQQIGNQFSEKPGEHLKKTILQQVEEGRSSQTNGLMIWSVAASIAFLIVSFIALYYRFQFVSSQELLISLQSEREVLAEQVQETSQNFSELQELQNLLLGANTQKIKLAGLPISKTSEATVFWEATSDKVILAINDLPGTPENQQYQAWAIVNGTPIDIGLLAKGERVHVLKNVKDVSAFAISLEPIGGSKTPTTEQIYVLGKVT